MLILISHLDDAAFYFSYVVTFSISQRYLAAYEGTTELVYIVSPYLLMMLMVFSGADQSFRNGWVGGGLVFFLFFLFLRRLHISSTIVFFQSLMMR